MVSSRWVSVGLLAFAVGAGAVLWLQRQTAADLRDERALLRDDSRELARLRVENQRLAAALPPVAKLEELRADRAAVMRLRGEIEKTRDNLEARERTLATAPPAAPVPQAPPALVATIAISVDGNLTRDGQIFELAALRQQLSVLPRGTGFEIRVRLPKADGNVPFDQVKQSIDVLAEYATQAAKDIGLRKSLRTEPAQP